MYNSNNNNRNNSRSRNNQEIANRRPRFRRQFIRNNRNANRGNTRLYPRNRNKRQINNQLQRMNNRNFYKFRRIENEITQLTKMIKKTSLGGGPSIALNTENQIRTSKDPRSNKEIRYDKLYTALEMYLMGKYYSFFKTSNMIVRLTNYSSYSVTLPPNKKCAALYYPYFYPYVPDNILLQPNGVNVFADQCSNFMFYNDTTLQCPIANKLTVAGNFRLIAATMKVTNTTTNSQKGGSFTIYRLTQTQGQPIYLHTGTALTNNLYIASIIALMAGNYDNEPVKFLYNGNQTALANEYGVIDGNTIFQQYDEYMGGKTETQTDATQQTAGGDSSKFNPTGLNVKYLIQFDPVTTEQTYKIQTFAVFEVVPVSTSAMATLAFKGDKCVSESVVEEAKNSFNLKQVKN